MNTALAGYASYYDPPLNDPDLYSSNPAVVASAYARIVVAGLGGVPDLAYTDEISVSVGQYLLWSVTGSTHRGVVFFHGTGYPGDDPGYNPQLGTEYATDSTTGENYLVDRSTNWSETGPQGPGYYVAKGGGDYQKLDPGRSD